MAAVVPAPGNALTPASVRAGLVGRLPATKVPKRVFLLADLPRNALGKVRRDLLRQRWAEGSL
jgi:malonyl-CoA/methylmalonyl-CoA synthetase